MTGASSAWEKFPIAPEYRDNPLWADNTVAGDDVKIFDVLPLIRLNDGDGGSYIDKAAVVSKDPDDQDNSGKQNVGIYRIEVKGRRKLALQPVPMHDIAQHLHKAEQKGEDLPVAITLGNDPVISIVASTPMAYDENGYELAGALRGAPAPIAKAPLTGLPVPWGSEVVIEGVIEGRKREIEGPFGEFTGHYSGGRNMTVIRIDRISYRTNPVFEHLYLGMPWTEIDYLMAANTCVPLYQQLKKDFPEVQAVNAMYTHGLVVIVSTRKRYGGFAKAVGMCVLTTPPGLGYAATVIVVDEDVDPFNLPQVMWALSTKMNPAGDLIQIPNMSVLELAPQANIPGITDKLVIDATTPIEPDHRGNYGNQVRDLPETGAWLTKLQQLAARTDPRLADRRHSHAAHNHLPPMRPRHHRSPALLTRTRRLGRPSVPPDPVALGEGAVQQDEVGVGLAQDLQQTRRALGEQVEDRAGAGVGGGLADSLCSRAPDRRVEPVQRGGWFGSRSIRPGGWCEAGGEDMVDSGVEGLDLGDEDGFAGGQGAFDRESVEDGEKEPDLAGVVARGQCAFLGEHGQPVFDTALRLPLMAEVRGAYLFGRLGFDEGPIDRAPCGSRVLVGAERCENLPQAVQQPFAGRLCPVPDRVAGQQVFVDPREQAVLQGALGGEVEPQRAGAHSRTRGDRAHAQLRRHVLGDHLRSGLEDLLACFHAPLSLISLSPLTVLARRTSTVC